MFFGNKNDISDEFDSLKEYIKLKIKACNGDIDAENVLKYIDKYEEILKEEVNKNDIIENSIYEKKLKEVEIKLPEEWRKYYNHEDGYNESILDNEDVSEFCIENEIERIDENNPLDLRMIGFLYDLEGYLEDAVEWYQKAAVKGDNLSQSRLVQLIHERNINVDINKWSSILREKAVDDGFAQAILGDMYRYGVGVEKNLPLCFDWYQKAAENGNVKAQIIIGYRYEIGQGVEKDPKEAYKWYKKAADNGDSEAVFRLGRLYELGIGVEPSCETAVALYMSACKFKETLYPEAAYKVGYAYYFGKGIDQNKKLALENFEYANDNGYSCSCAIELVKNDLNKYDDNIMCEYAKEIIKQNLSNEKLYDRVLEDLKEDFGDTWNLLQEKSQKCLITSLICYISLYSVNSPRRDGVDFTAAIIPMTKALEMEFRKYLCEDYLEYLAKKSVPLSKITNEDVLCYKDEKTKEKLYKTMNDMKFTLGSVALILGVRYKRKSKKETISPNIDQAALEYAKMIFKVDAFGEENMELAIIDYLATLSAEISTVKDAYRDPAAHLHLMTHETAESCASYLIKSKKIIRKFLEKLKTEV